MSSSKLLDIDLYSSQIVHGYIHEIEQQIINNFPVPQHIVDSCLLFYYRYYLDIQNINPTPFTLLFAIHNDKQLIHFKGLTTLNVSQQIGCLNEQYQISQIYTINNKLLSKKINHILSQYNTKKKLLLSDNDITQWTNYDIIISFISYLVNNRFNHPKIWEFVMYFRKYCNECNYHGIEFLIDYKKGLEADIKGYGLRMLKKICVKYDLTSGPFTKGKVAINKWAQIVFKQHTINHNSYSIIKEDEHEHQHEHQHEHEHELLVYGYINEYANGFVIYKNIYETCLKFYKQFFIELNEITPSPLNILFAIFNIQLPLKIKGWENNIQFSEQCNYLMGNISVMELMQNIDIDIDIQTEIKYLKLMYNNEIKILSNKKHIFEWDYNDIILSIYDYYMKFPMKKKHKIGWNFMNDFRRYLYDTKYNGCMLCECINDYKCEIGMQLIKDICRKNKCAYFPFQNMAIVFNKWCKILHIKFNKSMNNKSEIFLTDMMRTGQEFIYKTDKNRISLNNLLVFGYCRNELCVKYIFIPHDINNLIEQFYGKTYFVFGEPPLQNEFDYAVEFLLPMERIGINLNKTETKITNCSSKFAQKNIIPNSDIIQINNSYVKNQDLTVEQNDTLWVNLKQKGNSFVILRAEKELNRTGTHLMFDIKMNGEEKEEKFPFYKFDLNSTLQLFEDIWKNNKVEIFDIFANKSLLNGGGNGVSILLFVDKNVDWSLYKQLKLENQLSKYMNDKFIIQLSYKMNGLKGYGINTSWSTIQFEYWDINTKSLSSLIYLVKGVDEGRNAWYYILVEMDKLKGFLAALKDPIIHLEQYGKILNSAYGDDAPQNITNKLKRVWNID